MNLESLGKIFPAELPQSKMITFLPELQVIMLQSPWPIGMVWTTTSMPPCCSVARLELVSSGQCWYSLRGKGCVLDRLLSGASMHTGSDEPPGSWANSCPASQSVLLIFFGTIAAHSSLCFLNFFAWTWHPSTVMLTPTSIFLQTALWDFLAAVLLQNFTAFRRCVLHFENGRLTPLWAIRETQLVTKACWGNTSPRVMSLLKNIVGVCFPYSTRPKSSARLPFLWSNTSPGILYLGS